MQETGTLEHRFHCAATMPEGGWPEPPPKARPALQKLNAGRLKLLQTRALLVLRVPIMTPKAEGDIMWLLEPNFNDAGMDAAVWFFDGSMLNGKWMPLRSTGFGIAVVSRAGKLMACARGCPPHWCATAAAAEAWALLQVLKMQPFPPSMVTDCMALLTTLQGDPMAATRADKQLARIWVGIADTLGGCFRGMAETQDLIWMPAHTTTRSVGEVKLSNGLRLTMLHWRANRLVDGLAKLSAAQAQDLPEALRLISSSEAAVRHAAKLLGRTTHAANHHRTIVTGDDGSQKVKFLRDAMAAPNRPKRRLSPRPQASSIASAPAEQQERPSEDAAALPPPLKARKALSGDRVHWAEERRLGEQRLRLRVDEIGSSLRARPGAATASDRMAALRRRVGLPSRPEEA